MHVGLAAVLHCGALTSGAVGCCVGECMPLVMAGGDPMKIQLGDISPSGRPGPSSERAPWLIRMPCTLCMLSMLGMLSMHDMCPNDVICLLVKIDPLHVCTWCVIHIEHCKACQLVTE